MKTCPLIYEITGKKKMRKRQYYKTIKKEGIYILDDSSLSIDHLDPEYIRKHYRKNFHRVPKKIRKRWLRANKEMLNWFLDGHPERTEKEIEEIRKNDSNEGKSELDRIDDCWDCGNCLTYGNLEYCKLTEFFVPLMYVDDEKKAVRCKNHTNWEKV